ncbi:PPE domain-containing protein [Saccharopolyspora sp. 5N708]|uniref:PPE domain-containing protein n=1 Tax=Saccharopolyspora sp. 5N708 TaxID=3457424 RepID=UPI003FD47BE2
MVLPFLVGGYLLTRESDRGNTDEIMQQVGFNHPEKYQQIHGGRGTDMLVNSVQSWKSSIADDFDAVAALLDEANAKAGVAWTGQAAEEHGSSLAPMTEYIRDAKDVSTSVGDSAEQQVQNFSQVKNSMPEPVKVTATDNLLEKGGAWLVGGETDLQKQEREATEKAEEAKQYYNNYSDSTRNVSQSLAFYPKAPEMAYDAGPGTTGTNPTVGSMPTGSGIGGGGVSGGGSTSGVGGISGGGASGGGASGGGASHGSGDVGGYTQSPSQSSSQWSTPQPGTGLPTGPGTGTGPGAGSPATGGGGLGGAFAAGGLGAGGGAGVGRGAGGLDGRGLGAGGRAGVGGLGSGAGGAGGAAGASGRGGASGAMGGAAGRGQGKEGEEDLEHENKYWVDTDEAWDELGLPKVAPPVFGE